MLSGCQSQSEAPNQFKRDLVLVELTASDCRECKQIHPIIQDLKPKYEDKLDFVAFDVTTSDGRANAMEASRLFNGTGFIARYMDRPGTVGLLSRKTGGRIRVLMKDDNPDHYQIMLENALDKGTK